MENNNSKQAILSIVGIAILVIAVVGVSFAFFTYSRTGEKNNIITTGSITFDLKPGGESGTDKPTIKGEDSFPEDDTTGENDPNKETKFDVTGDLPEGANSVKYVVYAIAGEKPAAEKGPSGADWAVLPNEAIKMKLDADVAEGGTLDHNYYETAANPKTFTIDTGDSQNGFKLAEGTITAGEGKMSHKFTLHMWMTDTFNEGKVVSDTDYSYKYRASAVSTGDSPVKSTDVSGDSDATKLPHDKKSDDRLVWTDQYYAVKIKVVASDDPSFNS